MSGLEISGLCQRFLSDHGMWVEALESVSFSVEPGQVVALLGPSGCGKSSLLNIVAGFERAAGGAVRFQGEPLGAPSSERCMVFQSPALFDWLTVLQNVTYGLKRSRVPAAERRRKALEMLERVGLSGFEGHYPHELSGGMQQRVALARCFVLSPRLLLMDEPFAALDAQLREQMQLLLCELWTELRQTILFVTHDIEEAVKIAHRILVFTPRPGSVKQEFLVPAPLEARREPGYGDALQQLRGRLHTALFN